MNKAERLLVNALESGKYRQARESLKVTGNKKTAYCCLGVACEVFRKTTGKGKWENIGGIQTFVVDRKRPDNLDGAVLPAPVARWLGWTTKNGTLKTSIDYASDLIDVNDELKYNFKEIANIIRTGQIAKRRR